MIRGKIEKIVFKHDGCRVIQTMVKYGNNDQRNQIYEELKGRMCELAKNHFGHFLSIKMLKYIETKRSDIIKEFRGHGPQLIVHKDASKVLEVIFSRWSNSQQKHAILMEFYGPEFILLPSDKKNLNDIIQENPKKRISIAEHLQKILDKAILKGPTILRHQIIHSLLINFLSIGSKKQLEDIISSIEEYLVEMVHTQNGASVAALCVSLGSTKNRKKIIKSLKGYVPRICKEEYGHVLILRLIEAVDDVAQIKKFILSEIITSINELAEDRYGSAPFLLLLNPENKHYFTPFSRKYLQPTVSIYGDDGEVQQIAVSKKAFEKRRESLLEVIEEPLLKYCSENVKSLIASKFGKQLLQETVLRVKGDKTPIWKVLAELASTATEEENILYASGRVYSAFLNNNSEDSAVFAKMLMEHLKEKHILATKVGPAFLILDLLKHPAVGAQLTLELAPHKVEISKSEHSISKLIVEKLG